jgi:hypothetical protein
MSVKDFLTQYASANDFIVHSSVKPGAGASEAKHSGTPVFVRSKADFRSTEEKVALIQKQGAAAYAKLPIK